MLLTRSKTDQHIKAGCNIDAKSNEYLMHLITSKLDQNIINKLDQKLDQKRINRSKLDAIKMQYQINLY